MDPDKILSQLFAEFAKGAAGVAAGLLDSTFNKLVDLYKKDFGPYLENSIKRCTYVKTIISREEPIPLASIYVAPRLRCGNRFFDEQLFVDAMGKRKRILVTGTAGSGKSMFLKFLFLSLIENSGGRIPLFIELRQINETPGNTDLGSFIRSSILNPGAVVTDEQFRAGLTRGLFTLILDGLDEVDHDRRTSLQQQLLSFQERYVETVIVISSRPDERLSSWIPFSIFQILPMDMPRAISLINKVDYDRPLKNKLVQAMRNGLFAKHKSFLSNPLLALMMLITFDQGAHIPEKMHIFYEHAFDALFFKHDASKYGGFKRKTYTRLPIDDFKNYFSSFCMMTYAQKKLDFSESEVRQLLKKALQFEGASINIDDLLNDLIESVCMFQRDGMSLTFSHRSFQEFFAAFFISRSPIATVSKLIDQISVRHSDNVIPMLFNINKNLIEREWVLPKLSSLVNDVSLIDMSSYFYKYLNVFYTKIDLLWDGGMVRFEVERTSIGHFRLWLAHLYPEAIDLGFIQLDKNNNRLFLDSVRELVQFGDRRFANYDIQGKTKISPGFTFTLREGDTSWLGKLTIRDTLERDRVGLGKMLELVNNDMSRRQNVLDEFFE